MDTAVVMEQHKQGLVDLMEIYHARQLRDQILTQLKRVTADNQQLALQDIGKKRELAGYYQALLITTVELLQQIGDVVETDLT